MPGAGCPAASGITSYDFRQSRAGLFARSVGLLCATKTVLAGTCVWYQDFVLRISGQTLKVCSGQAATSMVFVSSTCGFGSLPLQKVPVASKSHTFLTVRQPYIQGARPIFPTDLATIESPFVTKGIQSTWSWGNNSVEKCLPCRCAKTWKLNLTFGIPMKTRCGNAC